MPYFAVRLLRVIALFLLIACPALAGSQDWTVTRATKQVSYTVDKTTWHPVETGAILPNQAWISTGPRGRATLARGTESISLQPNTLGAVITTQGLFSRKTDVVQQKGQMALNIEKRSRPHTYVHTPFLAAVVKGTSFTVTVTEEDASLSVQEGLVQVSSFTGGQSTHVGAGQQVTVDQNQTMSVAGLDARPSIESVAPSAASIAAVGQVSPIGVEAGSESRSDQSASSGGASSSSSGNTSSSSDSSSGNGGYSGRFDAVFGGRGPGGDKGLGGGKGHAAKGPDGDTSPGGKGLRGDKGPGSKGPGGGKGSGGKGPGGDKGPDGKGPGADKGPGGKGPDKGPGGKGPAGDKGPGGKGPGGNKGPEGKGPGGDKGPDGKGPGGDKGPGGKGPDGDKGPGGKGSGGDKGRDGKGKGGKDDD